MKQPVKRAFSYIRFSSASQGKESKDSLRRQTEVRDKWLARHPEIELANLEFKDLGKSAFQKDEQAGLKRFMQSCKDGIVNRGDFLLVESIDRISRKSPMTSFEIIRQLVVDFKITVVSLSSEIEYSEQSLNEDNGKIYILLGELQRAHNESKLKSQRINEAWDNKRILAQSGIKRKTTKCPFWLKWNEDRKEYDEIPERTNCIREIFRMHIEDGFGAIHISRIIGDKYKAFGRNNEWTWQYITKIMGNKEVIGYKQFYDKNNKPIGEPIENHYPAIIDKDIWYQSKAIRSNHSFSLGRKHGIINNLFTGLLKCGNCGSTMYYKKTFIKTKSGTKNYSYLVCREKFQFGKKSKCSKNTTIQYEQVEKTILSYLSDSLDLNSLLNTNGKDDSRGLKNKLSILNQKLNEIEKKIMNWSETLGDVPKTARQNIIILMKNSETEKKNIVQQIGEIQSEINQIENDKRNSNSKIENIRDLISRLKDDSYNIKPQLVKELNIILSSIHINIQGEIVNYVFNFSNRKQRIIVKSKDIEGGFVYDVDNNSLKLIELFGKQVDKKMQSQFTKNLIVLINQKLKEANIDIKIVE